MTQVHPPSPGTHPAPPAASNGDRAKTRAIVIWVVIGVLFLGAAASAVGSLERTVYGARGVVSEYLDALARKDAVAALEIPGVKLGKSELAEAGLPENASAQLLRGDVMSAPTNIEFVEDTAADDGIHEVTYDYEVGSLSGSTTFELRKVGGLFGHWEFATSPLAGVNLTLKHTTQFTMNGFDLDSRQVSPEGTEPAFENIANVLVFTPGVYTFQTDTDFLASDEERVFADVPAQMEEATVTAEPTDAFVEAVQEQFNAELDACAEQVVLQPTGCPFGYHVADRVSGEPEWSINAYPDVELAAGSDSWVIPDVDGSAEIDVDIQSLADGSVRNVTERVPFSAYGAVYLFSDGTITTQLLTEE